MQNLQFIVALDASARFVHLFLADKVDLPIGRENLIGETLGKYAANEPDSRKLRATFAECLFTCEPQECVLNPGNGESYQFRFERVAHQFNHTLRSDDEVVVISVITRIPEELELTKREQQIVKLICRDMSNAEIAKELKVSASTIETHRHNIRQKLGVNGNAGLVLYGVRHGLVD